MSNEQINHGPPQQQPQQTTMIDPDDPLLIAQSLTYITDNGSIVASFQSAPFSFGETTLFYFISHTILFGFDFIDFLSTEISQNYSGFGTFLIRSNFVDGSIQGALFPIRDNIYIFAGGCSSN